MSLRFPFLGSPLGGSWVAGVLLLGGGFLPLLGLVPCPFAESSLIRRVLGTPLWSFFSRACPFPVELSSGGRPGRRPIPRWSFGGRACPFPVGRAVGPSVVAFGSRYLVGIFAVFFGRLSVVGLLLGRLV